MRPENCSAVLLPDRTWHGVEPGSLSEFGERVTFIEIDSGELYQVPSESVLAARGKVAPLPTLQRA